MSKSSRFLQILSALAASLFIFFSSFAVFRFADFFLLLILRFLRKYLNLPVFLASFQFLIATWAYIALSAFSKHAYIPFVRTFFTYPIFITVIFHNSEISPVYLFLPCLDNILPMYLRPAISISVR